MLRIDVITLFPEMFTALTNSGITARACQRGLLQVNTWNPRDDTHDRHRTVDDRPYGGGPGMVMKVQPLRDCLTRVRQSHPPHPLTNISPTKVIYLSPQGRLLNQAAVQQMVTAESHTMVGTNVTSGTGLILIAGRYEGIDERFIASAVDEEWSIGDYVLSGGELAAMVLIDALTRLLPGALGDQHSAQQDSFSAGLLDHSHYTRPEQIDGLAVPAVLLSGDHEAIRRWQLRDALGRTWQRRPELLQPQRLSDEQRLLLNDFIQAHQPGASK